MHAANLLNKRRQQREDHSHKAVSTPPEVHRPDSHRAIRKKTNSQTSFLDSIGAGACSTPTSSAPRIPTISESTHSRPTPGHGHKQGNQSHHRNGSYADGYHHAEPLILYHKPERISGAHIGLCIMIVGTIATIIAGFVCYLLSFGEPGVIIGCGGAIITVIGLILLCCGNRWQLDEQTLSKTLPAMDTINFVSRNRDPESGSLRRTERVGDKLEVSKLPKSTLDPDPTACAKVKVKGLSAPVLEIEMVSGSKPSGPPNATETDVVLKGN